ncbi:hypothetical protein AVEN_242820-1 [Araneus ventricosus]|uniref:Uncharacterized protein n=1 Tax=Araneus ventricosus TaxID=182803 RepID=A0A4Y2BZ73_ARAVE|nr:hypothetical protein AVEN_242820-1 [Araneus ventricosus]
MIGSIAYLFVFSFRGTSFGGHGGLTAESRLWGRRRAGNLRGRIPPKIRCVCGHTASSYTADSFTSFTADSVSNPGVLWGYSPLPKLKRNS